MPLLSFGSLPPANGLVSSDRFGSECAYALALHFCLKCSLVQSLDVRGPEVLLSCDVCEAQHPPAEPVLEIGPLGCRVLTAEGEVVARPAPFCSSTARYLRDRFGRFRVVRATDCLACADEPYDFLRGVKELLARDGIASIEVPSLRSMVEEVRYDIIRHERLSYFSVTALLRLLSASGLWALGAECGADRTLRICTSLAAGRHCSAALELAEQERSLGLGSLARYREFAAEVEHHRQALRDLMENLQRGGATTAGWGASSAGCALLNFCGIAAPLVEYVADPDPQRAGLYTPGTHVPVLTPEALEQRPPDYLLLLDGDCDRWDGERIVVFPEPEIAGRNARRRAAG